MTKLVFNLILATILTLYNAEIVNSYSTGAPTSVCGSMTPDTSANAHGAVEQPSSPPYSISVSKNKIKSGEIVEVTLEGTEGTTFKGFLARGSSMANDDQAAGDMSLIEGWNGERIKTIGCDSGRYNAITHRNGNAKTQIKFEWKAPSVAGEYVILATFVQKKDTFWLKHKSEVIVVEGSTGDPSSTTPLPTTQEPAEVNTKLKEYYDNCGKTKGCFGAPSGCVENRNCEMMSSWAADAHGNFAFQIAGKLPGNKPNEGHVSMGWSFDDVMGQDSVVGCVYDNGIVEPKSFYNVMPPAQSNEPFTNPTVGLVEGTRKGEHIEGWLFCDFVRTPIFDEPELQHKFDFQNDLFYILLARASEMEALSRNASQKRLGFHGQDRAVSAEATHMADLLVQGGKSTLLIQLHGAVMVIAWVMTSSLGIFVARYYKQTHTDFNPFNKAFWFVLHVGSMLLTIGLTFLGVIFIFVEVRGYSAGITSKAGKAHPILGLILTGICCLQLTIGLLRPHPGTPKRPIFNWVHWTAGNVGHIVGVACIFLVTELTKSGVQGSLPWLITVITFVVFHVVMHGTLSIHTVWADKQMDSAHRLRGISMGPMKPSKPEEAPGTGLRTFLLLLYIGGILAIGITLITLIVLAHL